MAVLSRDDFFTRLNTIVGSDVSDESIQFIEDMTDTYNDMEKRITSSESVDWEKKYHENDEAWKKKYTNRFFSGNGNSAIQYQNEDKSTEPQDVTFNDLFK